MSAKAFLCHEVINGVVPVTGRQAVFFHDGLIDRIGVFLQFAQVTEILQDGIAVPECAAPEDAVCVTLFIRYDKEDLQDFPELLNPVKGGKVFSIKMSL